MSSPTRVSIIICTCNRAADLRQTLSAIAQVCVPEQMPTELLVVDNASTDATAEVVTSCRMPNMPVRYIHEPRRGKGYAYNRGMAEARGEVFLFTDDDVRPPKNWIGGMCTPILTAGFHSVQGSIVFPKHLSRRRMSRLQRICLASTEHLSAAAPPSLIGANMAFSREIMTKVPSFDVELGPGALGYADDTLFGRQVIQAGFSTTFLPEVALEHHFDAARLERSNFLALAEKSGRSSAYVAYHWEHTETPSPSQALARAVLRLAFWRMYRGEETRSSGGVPDWEINLLRDVFFYKQTLIERKRARNYEKYGLVKRIT